VQTAPPSGSACNGVYNGVFNGNLVVSPGQSCVFIGGGVTGNVAVVGGYIGLNNFTASGNIDIRGPVAFSIANSTLKRNLAIDNLSASSVLSQLCGTSISGNLEVQSNRAPVNIGGPQCAGNNITGNVSVSGNSAPMRIYSNQSGKNLSVTNNTGAVSVYQNNAAKNLSCSGNTTISGGGNTAASKSGQCSGL